MSEHIRRARFTSSGSIVGRFAAIVGALLALSLFAPAMAAGIGEPSTPGSLQARGANGTLVEMPLRHTDVKVEITAFVARATVEQTFLNPFEEPVEAIYTFPLGDRAAVDDFELVVGERVIRGEIRRREEARRVYEEARRAGQRAALLEQERPNIFTQSVANLEPGREIKVRIRTVETVDYEAGVYRWTFPLVVGPRYIPGGAAAMAGQSTPRRRKSNGKSSSPIYLATRPLPPTPAAPDAPHITPAVLGPGFRSGHDVSIDVTLDAGVPIASLSCPSHRMRLERNDAAGARIRLEQDDSIPNKDFVLRWNVSSREPAIGLLAHRTEVDGFFTLLVQPKGEIDAVEAAPKEIVFVLDTSGSMTGVPIEASKRFIRRALSNLGPRDTFNLIEFSSGARTFSKRPLFGDEAEIAKAVSWVNGLRGHGGTEMLTGFRAAFDLEPDPDRVRIVIFLTDGYIGNEHQILQAIAEVVGEAHIFTLGIGSSVNHYLLDRMARLGRGAYTVVNPNGPVEEVVQRFRKWVTRPYLTDVVIDWGALPIVDVLPERPPDLFSGQTLNVVGRYIGEGSGEIVVRGRLGGAYWEQSVPVVLPDREEGHASLASIWARRRIADLMLSSPAGATEAVRTEVTSLALEFRLMSAFTSFVAVDDSEIVNPGGKSATVHQALPLPESVTFGGIFGSDGPAILRDDPQPIPDRIANRLKYLADRESVERSRTKRKRSVDAGGSGGLSIAVSDESGPLPGATVTISHETGIVKASSLLADSTGVAGFPVLPPGKGYRIEVSFPGFNTRLLEDVEIPIDDYVSLHFTLAQGVYERVRVAARERSVDLDRASSSTRFSDGFVADLPVPGRFYENVITLAPGVQDADGDGNPDVHGARSRDFKATVSGVGNVGSLAGSRGMPVDPARPGRLDRPAWLIRSALRVLADVADDGKLSPADGIPAIAALMDGQSKSGALSRDVRWHALATWALVEASAALPDDPWLRESTDRAVYFLSDVVSARAADAQVALSLDDTTQRWCARLFRWLADGRPAEQAQVRDYLKTLRPAEAKLSGAAFKALDRLIGSLPKENLILVAKEEESSEESSPPVGS